MKFYQCNDKEKIIAAVYEEWQREDDPPTREYEAWSVVSILASPPRNYINCRIYLPKAQLDQEYHLISEKEAEELAPALLKCLREVARPDEVRPAQSTLHAVCTHGEGCKLLEHRRSKVRRNRETVYTILNDVLGEPIAVRLTEEGEYMSLYRSPGTLAYGRLLDHDVIIATLHARGYEKVHFLSKEEFDQKADEINARHLGITVEEWRSF